MIDEERKQLRLIEENMRMQSYKITGNQSKDDNLTASENMELDDEIDAIDPELYRASSSQLMKYAEEELIREEEINR